MKTKTMIAAFAVLMMAFAAFAAVPVAVDDAADVEIVNLSGEVTSTLVQTSDQKVIIDGNLTIKDGGSLTIEGELLVNQGVTVTIEKGGLLDIKGDAIIDGDIVSKGEKTAGEPGLNVELEQYENIVINGTVSAMGDTSGGFVRSVSIQTAANDSDVIVYGTLYVGTNADMYVDTVTVAAQGKLTVYGTVYGKLDLAGYAYFESAETYNVNNALIKFTDASAIVDIKAATGTIVITDADMYAYTDNGGIQYFVGYSGDASAVKKKAITYDGDKDVGEQFTDIVVDQVSLNHIKNVKITETVATATAYDKSDSTTKMYAETKMIIAPLDAAASIEAVENTAEAEITADGGKTVCFDTMTVYGAYVTIASSAEAVVSGTVTFPYQPNSQTLAVYEDGVLTVDGTVAILNVAQNGGIAGKGTVNAAYYNERNADDNTFNHYYTTLKQAIQNGAKDIETLGVLVIKEDTIVPKDVAVTTGADGGDGYSLLVKKGVKLTFANGSRLAAGGNIYVKGELEIENIDFGITYGDNKVYADVMKKTGSDIRYMNVYVALAEAQTGDEVRAYNPIDGKIVLDEDIILPALVSFYNVSDDKASFAIYVENGVTFNIAGALYMDDPDKLTAEQPNGWNDKTPAVDSENSVVKEYSVIAIAVNGIIVFDDPDHGLKSQNIYRTFKIAGAYYQNKTDTPADDGEFYISNIPLAFAGILSAFENTVNIYGEVTIDSNVTGTEKERILVTINDGAKVTFKDFTFAFGEIRVGHTNYKVSITMTGNIGTDSGRFIFSKDVKSSQASFSDEYINGSRTLALSGDILIDAPVSISGTVFFLNAEFSADPSDKLLTFEDKRLNIPSGAKAYIQGYLGVNFCEMVISGDVTVLNRDAQLNAGVLSVLGNLTVERIDNSSGIVVSDYMLIGGSTDSFNDVMIRQIGANAVVSGAGSFPALKDNTAVIVFSGATVSADVLKKWMEKDADSTEFYVDGSLWMTAYVSDAEDTYAYIAYDADYEKGSVDWKSNFIPALDNIEFNGWQTYDEKNNTYNDLDPIDDGYYKVGTLGYEKVYADVKKDVYNIVILADDGIDNIYIDGKVILKVNDYNMFEDEVCAGTHTISYALANGYSGEAFITSIDGKEIAGAGLAFTVDDSRYDSDKGYMQITLSGIQKSGYDTDPETHAAQSSGLSTTEILLIVAVVIIALVAVVLILRLNRS